MMKLGKLGSMCLVLGLMGCPPVLPAAEDAGQDDAGATVVDAGMGDAGVTDAGPANELPVIVVTAPSGTLSTATFTLTGKITDDVAVMGADWKIGTASPTAIVLAADGTFSITIDSPLVDSQEVVVSLEARDALGKTSAEARVTVDRVGPTINIISPAQAQLVTTATLTADAQVADQGGVNDVSFTFNGGTVAGTDRGSGRWTTDFAVEDEDRNRTFRVEATDAAGNVTTLFRTVHVDRLAPTITVTAPAANSVHESSVTLAVTTSADAATVTASFGGQQVTLTGSSTTWAGQLPLVSLDYLSVLVRITATDLAGNSAFVDHPIIADNIAPGVTVTAPLANSFHRGPVPISVTTTGATAAVTARLNGQSISLSGGPSVWTGSMPVPSGDLFTAQLDIIASDISSNDSFAGVTLNIDTVAPVIAFTSPSAGQRFNASALSGSSTVANAWTVTDADPQAATTSVNGSPSTALTISVPTSPTDDGRTYSTIITASDRAGNVTTLSRSYAVDRVAPTIASWTPVAETRNVDPLQSVITFSEPVFGAQASTDAVRLRFRPQPAGGTWDLNHTRFTLPLAEAQGTVVTVTLDTALADDFGNPLVLPADKRFHLVTTIASGALIQANIDSFAASSDADGVVTIAALEAGTKTLRVMQGYLGAFSGATFTDVGTHVSVNSWTTFDPSSLNPIPRAGVTIFNSAGFPTNQHKHFAFTGYGAFTELAQTGAGAVISGPPLANEGTTALMGNVIGTTYTRGSVTVTLPTPGNMVIAQSSDSWAAVSYVANTVQWSRYRCNRNTQIFPGPASYTCSGTEYARSYGQPVTAVSAAMTRSGRCLSVNITGNGTNTASLVQLLENCDGGLGVNPPASCASNLSVAPGGLPGKVTPFSGNGEDTLLFAWNGHNPADPTSFRLSKMAAGTCGSNGAVIAGFTIPNVRDYAPIQYGNKPAMLYVNTSNELRIHVP